MTMTYEEQMAGTSMDEKNANLRAAVEARLFAKHNQNDDHPVLSDPDDEGDDEPDPLHESTLKFIGLLYEMSEMHHNKSADYGSEEDPLANIRQGAEAVGIEPWRGCFLRMMDKVQRLKTYCSRGTLANEGVRDTLLDLASYCLIGAILHDEVCDA